MVLGLKITKDKLFEIALVLVLVLAVIIASFGKLMLGAIFGLVLIVVIGLIWILLNLKE